jgi:hypothetical protein
MQQPLIVLWGQTEPIPLLMQEVTLEEDIPLAPEAVEAEVGEAEEEAEVVLPAQEEDTTIKAKISCSANTPTHLREIDRKHESS